MKEIILASSSPRRKELLELVNIPFKVHPSDVNEEIDQPLPPNKVVEELALRKAKDIAKNYQQEIIIGADTIVVLSNEILGKPCNEQEAHQMLSKLQGRVHEVYSGVAVIDSKTGETVVSHRVTKVHMQSLTDEQIKAYIETKEPMDKAGSYGIQGIGAIFIEQIEGDYFNVVGLPLSLLTNILKRFEIDVIKDCNTSVKA